MQIRKMAAGLLILFIISLLSIRISAQDRKIPASLRASVTQYLGTQGEITINYGRPGVKGREIWGGLVPYGLSPGNKYSKDKPYPWRAGANENTTIEFSEDGKIDGHKVPAGKYGIHMIPGKDEWVIIFSKDADSWGSYSYDETHDLLRIKVKPIEVPFVEWLTFGFDNLAGNSAIAYLHWEKLRIPFKVEVE